jgi:hypothetical protein
MLMAAVALGLLLISPDLSAQTFSCAAWMFERPGYPRLARVAKIKGVVEIRLKIGPDGRPTDLKYEGHPLLSQAVREALGRTKLDSACVGTAFDLRYRFEFEGEESYQPMTSVSFNPPSEFVVTTNPPAPIIDGDYVPVKPKNVKPKAPPR